MKQNYEVKLNAPSTVFKNILDNILLVEGCSILEYDHSKLKIKSTLIGAVQYFVLIGLQLYKFAYIRGNEIYYFRDKESMTKSIKILADGHNLQDSSVMQLPLGVAE